MIPPRLILDCDPGLDDAVALALALHFADVVGVSTVGGNVALDKTTANALSLCDILGRPEVPVHAGYDVPLNGSVAHRASEYHGPFGTGSVRLTPAARTATSNDAVGWIIETVRGEEGLWLVPTGPLTNIATALRSAPDLVHRIAGISWMGGSSTSGNMSVAAEFNCAVDPEAADIVFRCGHPNLVMLGLNVTHTVLLDRTFINDLATLVAGTATAVFGDLLTYYEERQRSMTTLAGAAVHDALAVLYVTHRQLFGGVRRPVEIVLSNGPTRGMTLVDQRPRRHHDGVNATVVEWADADAIRALIVTALTV